MTAFDKKDFELLIKRIRRMVTLEHAGNETLVRDVNTLAEMLASIEHIIFKEEPHDYI